MGEVKLTPVGDNMPEIKPGRSVGRIFMCANKLYIWSLNEKGKLEAVKLDEAMDLAEEMAE